MASVNMNKKIYEKAVKVIPGGVNSPVRAFKSVGGDPIFVKHGKGSKFTDENGREYIDYCCSWGPLILGHADARVVAAVKRAADKGMSFGISTAAEECLATMLCKALPSMEKVRFVSSGTEATMSAIRLARGFTGRTRIIKFDGCYHGHADFLLAGAGSGVATLGIPDSAGVPAPFVKETIVLPYNDLGAVKNAFKKHKDKVACVILEPIAGNMGVVPPAPGFLEGLRKECTAAGALLIFDEVISGFRAGFTGAQGLFGVTPDLTCLGKIIGGGMPVGAYGGRADIMDKIAPLGPVYQAGTLSGNPVAMAAGIATVSRLANKSVYKQIEQKAEFLCDEIQGAAGNAGVPVIINRVGSMFTIFFTTEPVTDFASAKKCDTKRFAKYFHEMLKRGVYVSPSQFEANFVSAAHSWDDIRATHKAAAAALKKL
jgi:glutamate-1-semialdehyde 2,1-aminomutase